MTGEIFQLSTIGALLEGGYEGTMPYSEIARHGDFGLGTFNLLDGEMVALDGKFYQITDQSGLQPADMANKAPFAVVKFFQPEFKFEIKDAMDWPTLQKAISTHISNKNAFCAIKISGSFHSIKVRTAPKQAKPFKPMTDVARTQPEFDLVDQTGILVGFHFPNYSYQICVPGFHLHFINKQLDMGGHLLACLIKDVVVELDYANQLHLQLPEDDWFAAADLDKDQKTAVAQVEGHAYR